MEELTATTASPRTAAEYRAAINELLDQMQRMNEQSERARVEIEQLKAETQLIKARTDLLKADTRTRLGELLARFG